MPKLLGPKRLGAETSRGRNGLVPKRLVTRSLISAFFVRCLDGVMSLVSVTKISSLILASVAEQASLPLTWSETPEDTFSHGVAQLLSTKGQRNVREFCSVQSVTSFCARLQTSPSCN